VRESGGRFSAIDGWRPNCIIAAIFSDPVFGFYVEEVWAGRDLRLIGAVGACEASVRSRCWCGDGSEGAAPGARVDEGACGEGLSGMRAQYTSV